MAKRRKKSSSADVVTLEFGHKDAKGGGRFNKRTPSGDYPAKIIAAKKVEAKESGNMMIVWDFEITSGKYKGRKFRDRHTLVPAALFNIRNLLEALGVNVPEKTTKLKFKKYVGSEVGISLIDGEYNNKPLSEVDDFLPISEVGDDEDEELDDDELDEDEDDDEDDEDLSEMDRKELKSYIKENDLDVKVTKKMDEDDIREAIEEAEGDEDDEDDDDEDLDEVDLDEL